MAILALDFCSPSFLFLSFFFFFPPPSAVPLPSSKPPKTQDSHRSPASLPWPESKSSDRNQIWVVQPTHGGHMVVENLAARNRSLIRVHSLHRQNQLVIEHSLVRCPNRTSRKQLRRGSHQHLQIVNLCLSSTKHQVPTLLYPS